jgi:hypothetical protein
MIGVNDVRAHSRRLNKAVICTGVGERQEVPYDCLYPPSHTLERADPEGTPPTPTHLGTVRLDLLRAFVTMPDFEAVHREVFSGTMTLARVHELLGMLRERQVSGVADAVPLFGRMKEVCDFVEKYPTAQVSLC